MANPNVHSDSPAAPQGERVVVLLAGVDENGVVRTIQVDAQGRLVTVAASP